MEEKDIINIQNLFNGLKVAKDNNNLVQIEFCGALLSKYLQEGVNIYEYAPIEIYESLVKEGLDMFFKRKKRYFIKKTILNFFTVLAVGIFAYFYLRLNIYMSIIFFIVAWILDSLLKKTVNKIVFCVETKRAYNKFVSSNLLDIRKSEDESKLWK